VVSLWSSLSPRLWCALEDIELMQEALDGMPSALLDIPVERFPVGRRLLLSAVKTLVLLSQTEEDAELAKQFGVYPVEIDRLRQALPEALNSLAQVLDPLGFPQLEQAAKDGAAIIQSGLPLEAVALLDLRGVGPVLAGRLYEQGITPNNFRQTSAEAIAQVDGISIKGAKKLLIGAEKMMQRRYSLHRYRAQTDQRPWNYSIEPYRLRRSLELKHRTTPNPALRTVYGGSEERQVLRKLDKYHCSCPDFAKRQLDCKHILYCKQVDKDQEILQAVADLPDDVQSSLRCGLATLWQSVNRRLPW
ncbi:MAG: helix-hairpin-helix domain-containing protein, partial [Cyanobacteria bacterium P01_B01_bin.77]